MPTTPEPTPSTAQDGTVERPGDEPAATDAPERDPRPLSRFAARFRIPLGALVAVIGLVLAVLFVVQPPAVVAGTRGVVEHIALIALWLCVAAAGITWAIGLPRRVTNLCAAAGVGCYLVVWVAGL